MAGPFSNNVERMIREAIEKGEFDDLPGQGKPLVQDDRPPFVSQETWSVMKLMKNAGVLPKEVELFKEIEDLHHRLQNATSALERAELQAEILRKEQQTRYSLEQFSRPRL